ncbi:glyoxylate/hydroxypyruvate reductase A [Frigidibacter sp. RF13]|uniref:2-hydroxyacid dehydrogenase n=1 Tax=Frigidibacter sp. RF13 TaxID=2997340 RepID=UPI002271BE51|nr:glyoxylate/hydroxypyruvate reductase A [Frigidibacter sp. RF13]MCY1126402.1 glyoxylate/hydroxypyruvate reductase A [Frigidibacter sp. RF13]
MLNIYVSAGAENWADYREPLAAALARAGIAARMSDAAPDPSAVDYIVYAPASGLRDFSPFTRAKAVLSLWAGVEKIVPNPTLTMPLARMVNNELTEGMVEYVVGHVLRHHLGMDAHIHGQDGTWRNHILPPLARERPVAMLGLGELGAASARALAALNFPVMGWSRSQKEIAHVDCHAGEAGLDHVLSRAQIAVLLMPLTPGTTNIMNARRLGLMPKGAVIINPGRGPLIDDEALLAALDAGQIGHATLDVFRTEPLPPDHPYWAHPRVTVTPHIAADTRVPSACEKLVENIRRGEAGAPFLNLVDMARGY